MNPYRQARAILALICVATTVSAQENRSGEFGFDAGLLYKAEKFGIGVTYRSTVPLRLDGDVDFTTPGSGLLQLDSIKSNIFRAPASTDFPIPDLIQAGVVFRPSDRLQAESDVSWVNWTDFDQFGNEVEMLQQISGNPFQLELTSAKGSFLIDAAPGSRMRFLVPSRSQPVRVQVFQGDVLAVPRTPGAGELEIVIPGGIRVPVGGGTEISVTPDSFFITPLGAPIAPDLRDALNSQKWRDGFTFRLGGADMIPDDVSLRLGSIFDPTVLPDETLRPLLPEKREEGMFYPPTVADRDLAYMYLKPSERIVAGSDDRFSASYPGRAHLFGLSFGGAPANGATIATSQDLLSAPFALAGSTSVPAGSGGGGGGVTPTVPSFYPLGLTPNVGVNAASTMFFFADQADWFNSSVSFRRTGETSFTSCATVCYSNGNYSEVVEANNLAVGIVSGGSGTLFGNPFPSSFLVGTGIPMQTAQLGSANALITFTVAQSIALLATDATARGTVTGTFGVNFGLDKVGVNLNVAISGLNLAVSTTGGAANPAASNVNINRGGAAGTFSGFTTGSFSGTLSGFWNPAGNGMAFTGNVTRPAGNVTYGGVATR